MKNKIGIHSITIVLALLMFSNCAHQPIPSNSMANFCKKIPREQYSSLERIYFDSEWFELYRVAEGVTAIYEPFQWQEVISYLIEGEESALLFDSGNGIAPITEVVDFLTNKPVSVLNSHPHFDHVGGNFSFDKIYGLKNDFTINHQKGYKNSEVALEASNDALCKKLPQGVSQNNHQIKPYKITNFIENGEIIDLGNRQLEIIHTPGHTPDSIVLIDRKNRLMWTGDTYYSGPIWLLFKETNLRHYEQSLEKMIAKSDDIEWLLPAHNTPLADPKLLPEVLKSIKQVISGQIEPIPQGDGIVEYKTDKNLPFSFILRDEALPY